MRLLFSKKQAHLSITIFAVGILVGCASPEEMARQERVRALEQAQLQAQRLSQFQVQCDRYGFKRGSNAFAKCLQEAEQKDNEARERKKTRDEKADQKRSKEVWEAVCRQDLACKGGIR